ncbi:hypothetical protein HK098_007218 [Nowakowskiella sp. JEL0407]|nr:hypothetical protein HK098_007218 [Nowakowskiella sp. JEL0407]
MDFGDLLSDDEDEVKKVRHLVRYDYVAPISKTFSETTFDVTNSFSYKMAPQYALNFLEYLYMKKNYTEALRLTTQFIKLNNDVPEDFQVNPRDYIELCARCAIKLGKNETAVKLLETIPTSEKDVAVQLLMAECMVETDAKRALASLQRYLDSRGNDYYAWFLISKIFRNSNNKLVELRSLEKCIKIYNQSSLNYAGSEQWKEHESGFWKVAKSRAEELNLIVKDSGRALTIEDAPELRGNEWVLEALANVPEIEETITNISTRNL